ncbi:MAG: glutamine--fructose-6-phosphate aminotransferase, partial [bacterium]
MCGIIGYVGKREIVPVLINGLRRMEYRGYDSFGMSILEEGKVFTFKKVGKISDFDDSLANLKSGGQVGIAHTRWGTHGQITEQNAHPHHGNKGNIFVVHNGI